MTATRSTPTPAKPAAEPAAKPPRSRSEPRTPSRDRGVQRYAALIDATERLLRDNSPDAVGLYQIAREAGVPPASTYHFFPTKEAAFFALAQRYFDAFTRLGDETVDAASLRSWQDMMRIVFEQAATLYNTHPPAMKLFYGGYASLALRDADMQFNAAIAAAMFGRLDKVFYMPHITDFAKKFEIILHQMDAVFKISYLRHGRITDEYRGESLAAAIAYCRLFLPERTELREPFRGAAARRERVTLPPVLEAQPDAEGS